MNSVSVTGHVIGKVVTISSMFNSGAAGKKLNIFLTFTFGLMEKEIDLTVGRAVLYLFKSHFGRVVSHQFHAVCVMFAAGLFTGYGLDFSGTVSVLTHEQVKTEIPVLS